MDSLSTNTRDRPIKSVSPPATHLLSDAEFFTQDNFGASKPNVRVLRDHFFREGRLTEEHALFILKHTTKLLSWEPNMVEVQGSVTICGDIHGQYYDLLKLFDVGGLDSYLFLGNYVNRGYFGIECLLYLYVLKLWFPSKFTLLRGNHECHHLTEYFTFEHECLHKYTSRVYDACLVSFRALPVAALVDGRLLCVHGGLSPEFTLLSDILALNRFVEPGNSGLLCDLLWSDPIEGFGHEEERAVPPGTMFLHNAVRGCSFFFTYAAACQFLECNGLLGIIRGHKADDAGYTMYRKTLKMFPSVITLFSAPNYLDVYHNHGAILKYANQNITIRQYYESPHPYWLPNFQNAFTWSLPFVGEKITEMLRAILSICSEEELESDSDESEDELDADGQPRTRKTEEMRVRLAKTLGLPTPEGVARRRREIKNKIIAVGRVMRIFQLLREERESAAWLVDEEAESGALGVQGQIRQSMHNFEDARRSEVRRIPRRAPAEGLDLEFLTQQVIGDTGNGDVERLADRIAFRGKRPGELKRFKEDASGATTAPRNTGSTSAVCAGEDGYVAGSVNTSVERTSSTLLLLLRDPESYKKFLSYRGADAQHLLDHLQDLLDLDSFVVAKPLIFKALLRLSRASGLHPRCFALSGLQKDSQQVTGGAFGDIWKGLVHGQCVSIKIMRVFQDSDVEAVQKEFSREALIWRQLCHPNVLPFFGLYYLENRLCLVSPWMENGNIMKFLKSTNPSNEGRLSLILDVALGLQYLHGKHVVHGDLKGLNILLTPSGRACIADFGVSSVANTITVQFTHSTANVKGGTARYQAPELFQESSAGNHFGSDVYAFACVCYEIMTGKVPFHQLPNDMAVIMKVAQGIRPLRPLSCSGTTALDSLWELMQTCWDGKTEMRPEAPQIVQRLIGPLIEAKTTSSAADWDDTFTSKFRRSLQTESLTPSVDQIQLMLPRLEKSSRDFESRLGCGFDLT